MGSGSALPSLIATGSPVGPSAAPAAGGELLWFGLHSNPWGTPIRDHLVAYQPPTSPGEDWADTDAWIGPLKQPGPTVFDWIFATKDHLWLVGNCDVYRVDAREFLAAAGPAQTTNQWRKTYRQRLIQGGWQSVVRMHLFDGRPEEALKVLRREREALGPPDRLSEAEKKTKWVDLTLWEGLVASHIPGQADQALALYAQVADSSLAEPAARAAALLSEIQVAHQARRWQQVVEASDRLCGVFPDLKPVSEHDRFMPLVVEARRNLAATSASAPVRSAPVKTVAPAPPASAPADKPTVAVMPFDRLGVPAEFDALAEGLPEFLGAALAQTRQFTCLDRSALEKALQEQKLALLTGDSSAPAGAGPPGAIRIGRLVGARYIVTGSFRIAEGKVSLNAHLVDVQSGQIVRSAQSQGEPAGFLELIEQVAGKLGEAPVRLAAEASAGETEARPLARLHLARGLGRFQAGMYELAGTEFMKSCLLDPQDERARFWLARSHHDNHEPAHAAIELERFLKDFPQSRLSGEARRLLEQCRAGSASAATTAPFGASP
jgi:TolB-like protein